MEFFSIFPIKEVRAFINANLGDGEWWLELEDQFGRMIEKGGLE